MSPSKNHASQPQVTFRIDGRSVSAPEGSYVLDAARKAGIAIPTLCHHPDIESVGACRLCTVEVSHPNWKGWSGLMTACLYPVQNGIEVSTQSPRVMSARKGVLALLAARCPTSSTIRNLAQQYGATTNALTSDPTADNCILCGLCTRVCETFATSAISTVGRGTQKRVSSFADQPPGECVGCGGCVQVCPTATITAERTESEYRVWSRAFPTAHCVVNPSACVGCGSCEQACPFSVARVELRVDRSQTAVIPQEHCRGCGACVGACPTGAISQPAFDPALAESNNDRLVVFACPRSNLHESTPASDAASVVELPCVGRITVPMLLRAACSNTSGVLVLGRHQSTCRFEGAEDRARQHVNTARQILDLAGLSPDRVLFEEPAPGPNGPKDCVQRAVAAVHSCGKPMPTIGSPDGQEGLDASLSIVAALMDRNDQPNTSPSFLTHHGLPSFQTHADQSDGILLCGSVPALHILGEELFAPVRIISTLHAALDVLSHLGMPNVGVSMCSDHVASCARSVFALEPHRSATVLDDLLRHRGAELPGRAIEKTAPTRVAFDGTQPNAELLFALGYEPVDIGPDPLPDHFGLTPADRSRACARLMAAEQGGAAAFLVATPSALARWAMITRMAAWRSSRVLPFLGVQLAYHAIHSMGLDARHLDAPNQSTRSTPNTVEAAR